MKTSVVLLGASGSIGSQTLDVLRQYRDRFELAAFSVGRRTEIIDSVIAEFHPGFLTVKEEKDAEFFRRKYPEIRVYSGDEGLLELISQSGADMVINALTGYIGLKPTVCALECGKMLALANKESLVMGGKIVTDLAKKKGILIRPIDSEHSAIFQALQGNKKEQVEKLIITASGGSFRNRTRKELENVTVSEALAHPNWSMGKKITIDSATMMNKGFEVIEAHWLFDMDYDRIETVLHPESIVHSLVEYKDGAMIAELGTADMRVPIQYALLYPERMPNTTKKLHLPDIGSLTFREMSFERYPLLKLAYDAGRQGGNLGAALNGANEAAVKLFLEEKISFLDIERCVEETLEVFRKNGMYRKDADLENILESDHWAYRYVKEKVKCLCRH
ncbi:MAG: 1-deoxy-D-xylulose-5-phosphate reductoisomerase [Erysipelotrichales bacterium]|nr:1-deoxy-D-xylulose-5-phosphate reductoisomerase [Erysipelotrichales bacterium]